MTKTKRLNYNKAMFKFEKKTVKLRKGTVKIYNSKILTLENVKFKEFEN